MKVICFHNPEEENGYLSNWYVSEFKADGIDFTSMEQYMMYKKAVYFRDDDIAKEILRTTDVAVIKSLGRQVRNYNDSYWNGIRQLIVYKGLIEKFAQKERLKRMLKETENNILAECAVKDKIWGIGLSMKDFDRFDPKKWRGQNLLGYTLMMVRDTL